MAVVSDIAVFVLKRDVKLPRTNQIMAVLSSRRRLSNNNFLENKRQNPKGKRQFLGFSSPLTMQCNAFAAKGIIQSPITSCSRRDHSVYQAGANRNPENSERRRRDLSARKRVMGVHSACKVWYLRLSCCIIFLHFFFAPGRDAKYCDGMFVCLSGHISQKRHVQTSWNRVTCVHGLILWRCVLQFCGWRHVCP